MTFEVFISSTNNPLGRLGCSDVKRRVDRWKGELPQREPLGEQHSTFLVHSFRLYEPRGAGGQGTPNRLCLLEERADLATPLSPPV